MVDVSLAAIVTINIWLPFAPLILTALGFVGVFITIRLVARLIEILPG